MSKKHRHERLASPEVDPIAGSEEPTGEDMLDNLESGEAPEAPAAPAAETAEQPEPAPAPQEEPKAPEKAPESVPATPTTITPKEKVMSAEILKPKVNPNNTFAARRAANIVGGNHTVLGRKVLELFDKYQARMSVPSNNREECIVRIKMLQGILNTACPQTNLDLQTATDVARIVFDHLMNGWGTVYNDTNLFRMGDTLKGTAYDMDKLVLFFEAFVQMVEGVQEKKKVLFDDGRLSKVLKNQNMVIAMARIRDRINERNGFKA